MQFFGKTSNRPCDWAPLQPRFGTLWLLAFTKTKITFERENHLSDHWWDSGEYDRAAGGNWENCVRSQSAYFEGHWGVIVLCTMFLVSCIFFNKYLCFSYHMAGYLLDRPYEVIWYFTQKNCMRRDAWAGTLSWWSCQSAVAHSCSLLNHPNSFHGRMFKLNIKFDAVHCFSNSVILNAMATQYACLLNGIYLPHRPLQWSHHRSQVRIPVHSPWLPS